MASTIYMYFFAWLSFEIQFILMIKIIPIIKKFGKRRRKKIVIPASRDNSYYY